MNEYESFYNQLDHSIWNDFEEDCFYNSGEIEYEVVTDALERYIEKEGE